MKTITHEDIIGLLPAWLEDDDRACISAIASHKERWSAVDIIRACLKHKIDEEDILWFVLRPELIDNKTLRLLACDFAERALQRERAAGREPHPDSWRAVEVSRAFARGKVTAKTMAAAGTAASLARDTYAAAAAAACAIRLAYDAAGFASGFATCAAGVACVESHLASATRFTILPAFTGACHSAGTAVASERQWQVQHVLDVLAVDDAGRPTRLLRIPTPTDSPDPPAF